MKWGSSMIAGGMILALGIAAPAPGGAEVEASTGQAIVAASGGGAIRTPERYAGGRAKAKPARRRRVAIYLPGDGEVSAGHPFGLQPVVRRVNAAAPVRATLQALLAGPTAAEKRAGFRSLDDAGLRAGRIVLTRDACRVDFVSSGAKSWAGDLSPATFKQAVEMTLRRLLKGRRIQVSVNGKEDFSSLKG